MNNKSPLRYPGGKTRACKVLDQTFRNYFKDNNQSEFKTLISPFFGGGSFEFFLQNKYNLNVLANDKFIPLISFWNQCKHNNENLCKNILKNHPCSKEDFKRFRSIIMNDTDQFVQATEFFVINRCSFSGATLSGGFSDESSKKRFTQSSIERVGKLNLSNMEFECMDCIEFIKSKRNTFKEAFMFIDPPYYLNKKSKLYGNKGDLHENFNHENLYIALNELKNDVSWMMTYNNCDFIKNLYKDYVIIDVNWAYGMNSSKKSSEIVIINKI